METMYAIWKLEIEELFDNEWGVYTNDCVDDDAHFNTLAETYLYAAQRFHELGMRELEIRHLQERINAL